MWAPQGWAVHYLSPGPTCCGVGASAEGWGQCLRDGPVLEGWASALGMGQCFRDGPVLEGWASA